MCLLCSPFAVLNYCLPFSTTVRPSQLTAALLTCHSQIEVEVDEKDRLENDADYVFDVRAGSAAATAAASGGARDSSRPGVADSAEAVHDALYGIIHQDALQSATHAIESVLGKWKSSLTHRLEMRAQQGQDRTGKKVDLKTR